MLQKVDFPYMVNKPGENAGLEFECVLRMVMVSQVRKTLHDYLLYAVYKIFGNESGKNLVRRLHDWP